MADSTAVLWRAMCPADLGAVHALATVIHPAYPEDEAVFSDKLALFAEGCFVLEAAGAIAGYCFSHPWTRHAAPPQLNARLGALPASPSLYFLHDIALAESARGRGAAQAGLALVLDVARRHGIAHAGLISVSGTEAFWRAQGFAPVAHDSVQDAARAAYGAQAVAMERDV